MSVRIVGYGDKATTIIICVIIAILIICSLVIFLYKKAIKYRQKRNDKLWEKLGDK